MENTLFSLSNDSSWAPFQVTVVIPSEGQIDHVRNPISPRLHPFESV